MKSDIFLKAIRNRCYLRFLYGLDVICMEPYYISYNKEGKKVIYGKLSSTNEIKRFDFGKISNIKLISTKRFSPVIPIIPQAV